MQCENDFCIYNETNECLLEKIEVDNIGMCESCIKISLEKESINDYF